MQSVTISLRIPMLWGLVAVALTVIVTLVVGWMYISPPHRQLVTFYTDDAASVRGGDSVRSRESMSGRSRTSRSSHSRFGCSSA